MAPRRHRRARPAGREEAPAYYSWNSDKERALAMHRVGEAIDRLEPIVRATGSSLYHNIAPGNVSVRDAFTRDDWEDFRREERLPRRDGEIVAACMEAYNECGPIKNTIDVMSDFGMQGIRLVHPNTKIEQFYQNWGRRVGFVERSERFLNTLYRCGNVIVTRSTAKINIRTVREMNTRGEADLEVERKPRILRREIPWRYTILNPLSLELLGQELATFVGGSALRYAVRIPMRLIRAVKAPKSDEERKIIKLLPKQMLAAIQAGKQKVVLDHNKTRVFHYKKDDWEAWAKPMVHAILSDVQLLKKMKLADRAALDGAISAIRVWKLGSLEHKIVPSEATILRLSEMLVNNVGGGVMDLIWGPDLQLVETDTAVHNFLGETKYGPILTAIYAGLGIPPTLTGATTESGFTNNYISLKTLTERLEYGRAMLTEFWRQEIEIVRKAMGFARPAQVVYDKLLTDEQAERQLLIHLIDRNIISLETAREHYGFLHDLEESRIRKQEKARKAGKTPPQAGDYHDPHVQQKLDTLFAGTGAYAPSEFGVELSEKKEGEKTPNEIEQENQPNSSGSEDPRSNGPKGGRPPGAKDQQKRKRKQVNPRTSAEFIRSLTWAEHAYSTIADLVTQPFLKAMGKNNLRKLTAQEKTKFERFKFHLLCQFDCGDEITKDSVSAVMHKPFRTHPGIDRLVEATMAKHREQHQEEPNVAAIRSYYVNIYAMYKGESV